MFPIVVNETLWKRCPTIPLLPSSTLLLLLCLHFVASAQEMRFDHLSVEQKLSQGNASHILQDQYGFMWIATEDGLNLYDGISFTVFRNNPLDSNTITGNNIRCLAEDRAGNIWIGTLAGANMFDRKNNRFIRYQHNDAIASSLIGNEVNSIYFDSKNNLWISTASGLSLFDSTTQSFMHFLRNPGNDPDKVVRGVVEDGRKRLWVGTASGMLLMNEDRRTFRSFIHDPSNPQSISSNKVICLYTDKDFNLWIGTFDGGLNKLNTATEVFTRYLHDPANPKSLANNYVQFIRQNTAGEIWIATDGGLCRFNPNGTFDTFKKVEGDETTISSNITTCVYFDRNDRMWVSTRFGGVNVYDKDRYKFRHIRHLNHDPNSITNNTVTNFDEDSDGNLYISMDGGGINKLDRKTGKFSVVAAGQLSGDKVLAIELDDTRGGLWAGMWAAGLNYYDPKTNKVKKYFYDEANPKSLSDNNIFDILEDSKGNIWIGTFNGGLNKYNPATDDFTRFIHDPHDSTSISPTAVGYLIEDSRGKIWIATEREGVCELDPETGIFKRYRANANKPGSLSSNNIFSIFEDSDKNIWIGTDGGGLNMLDRKTNTFVVYRQQDGLPNDAIFGILEDGEKNIWVSTNKGLSRFSKEKRFFKNFTVSDGLQGNQATRWSFFKTSDGQLLFGGTNGFNIFDPSKIKDNPFIPPVYLTDFKLFNKSVPIDENGILKTSIMFTKEIDLAYGDNMFSFEFTALNLQQPEKNQYRYRMEGFQDEWIDLGTERKAPFTNLNPGEYTFRVIASNNDGVWNMEGASIKINIIPPFWKTWWFNSLIVVIIASSVVYYVRYQKKKAKRLQAELKAIIEEQTGEVKKQNEEIIRKSEAERVQNWITQGLATISDVISKQKGNLSEFSDEVLKHLVKYVQAQQGVMAVAIKDDPSDEHLKILATYGLNKEHRKGDRIEPGSGLIGATYGDKEKKTLENLPKDYLKVQSGLGEARPAKLILLPLKTDDGDILGVVELAFLTRIPDTVQEFLDRVSPIIALNIHAVNLNYKTTILLQQSKEQTEELRAQEEEMRQNMEEMEATQEEFRRREFEYQRKIQELENDLKSRRN
jgi:ligand-binding sensor domain-containing protein